VGKGGSVTRAVIEDLTGGDAAGDVFKVASALARGDTAAAVAAARLYLETEDRAEPRVLFELGLHLRRLLAARGNMAGGMSGRDAAKAAGVFWKDLDAFAGGLRLWSEPRIHEAFRRLLDADRRVKRGSDGLPAIEAYLWGLPRASRAASPGRRA
jgi:DNA polymerase-3 subunit delta